MAGRVTIVGAGVVGLWQALEFARHGFGVTVVEASDEPFANAASDYAGTMLSPDCEFPFVQKGARAFARRGLAKWQETCRSVTTRGSLVVAGDRAELDDLTRHSERATWLSRTDIAELEPDLALRFQDGLYFENEAHAPTDKLLTELLEQVQQAGVDVVFGSRRDPSQTPSTETVMIDCRGIAARDVLPDLRGVRGERIVLKTSAVSLSRPVRFLDLRQPIYIVPWGGDRFMLGATEIESDDASETSVKSAIDLLSRAYALHPAFGEAEILAMGAGVRPAFPDNLPGIIVHDGGQRISVNGVYRHGFLLAPALAEATVDFVVNQKTHPWLHHARDLHSPQKMR